MVAPAEKASQMIDDINAMLASGVDDAALQAVRDEAEKLVDVNYTAGKRVLGMLAAMQGDRETVDQEFQAALKASGGDWLIYSNYASALANLHDFLAAINVINDAVGKYSNLPDLLEQAIALHVNAWDIEGARDLIRQLLPLSVGQVDIEKLEKDFSLVEREEVLVNTGASWKDICQHINLAATALKPFELISCRRSVFFDDEGIYYQFVLDASLEDVLAADAAIMDAVAAQPYSVADRAISFSCGQVPWR